MSAMPRTGGRGASTQVVASEAHSEKITNAKRNVEQFMSGKSSLSDIYQRNSVGNPSEARMDGLTAPHQQAIPSSLSNPCCVHRCREAGIPARPTKAT